jgi:hypothetical protein
MSNEVRLWCLTPLLTMFQLDSGDQFYWWRTINQLIHNSSEWKFATATITFWLLLRYSMHRTPSIIITKNVLVKVILHQFWVKKIFPWKFNLEYGGTFTKLCMHVSSRNMFPTTRNLQIRVHVYRPRHYCGDWLTFGCCVPRIADHNLVKKFWSDDCRSWPREEKINNHGCWGKHAHIPDNDYWGICLFHVVWTNFFCSYSYVVHTEYIYIFFSSTEHCAWAIISPKEFKSCLTRISFALLYWKTELSAVKYFAICS